MAVACAVSAVASSTSPPAVVSPQPTDHPVVEALAWVPKNIVAEHQNKDGVPCIAMTIALSGGACVDHHTDVEAKLVDNDWICLQLRTGLLTLLMSKDATIDTLRAPPTMKISSVGSWPRLMKLIF